jgi:signal transduction histidine kinase
MRHVFLNLITNSIKFARREEPPVVVIEGIPCAEPGMAAVRVIDNGIGFDEKYKDKIFQPFQRLNPREYEGSGIGLSIVLKIVQNHGGRIGVKSEPGKGAEFTLFLPAA